MKITIEKIIQSMIKLIAVTTTLNILMMYWVPVLIPFSSFSAVRLIFLAYTGKIYYLIPLSTLICALYFVAHFSVKKQYTVAPFLLFCYMLCDVYVTLRIFFNSWCTQNDFRSFLLLNALVYIAIAVYLCIYCISKLRLKLLRSTE